MRVIQKHTFTQPYFNGSIFILGDANGQVIRVAEQHGYLCMWTLNNPELPQTDHAFHIVGTGHPVPDNESYLGSAQIGQYVWHVFKRIKVGS